MMPGMIMLWYGSIATIPSGWAFCDGTNGTPDLRNRFIANAQEDVDGVPKAGLRSAVALLQKWDSTTHNHAFTGDGHAHDLAGGNNIIDSTPEGSYFHGTTVSPADGDTESQYSCPKAYVLVYIMKLPIP